MDKYFGHGGGLFIMNFPKPVDFTFKGNHELTSVMIMSFIELRWVIFLYLSGEEEIKSLDVVEINLIIVTSQHGSHHALNIWGTAENFKIKISVV